jgi:hypothetical protein
VGGADDGPPDRVLGGAVLNAEHVALEIGQHDASSAILLAMGGDLLRPDPSQPLHLLVASPADGHDVQVETGSWFVRFPLGPIQEESDICPEVHGATSANQEPFAQAHWCVAGAVKLDIERRSGRTRRRRFASHSVWAIPTAVRGRRQRGHDHEPMAHDSAAVDVLFSEAGESRPDAANVRPRPADVQPSLRASCSHSAIASRSRTPVTAYP